MLGRDAILGCLLTGEIVCDPPAGLQPSHIDVHLSEHFWFPRIDVRSPLEVATCDPLDMWQYRKCENFVDIPPQTLVLGCTIEFIGSTVSYIQPDIETRSTVARWGLTAHLTAGQGDPGYCSRFTLEIYNSSRHITRLPIGARIAAVSFVRVEGNSQLYTKRYNQSKEEWTPNSMLPRRNNL